jgi:hypothetical protein
MMILLKRLRRTPMWLKIATLRKKNMRKTLSSWPSVAGESMMI